MRLCLLLAFGAFRAFRMFRSLRQGSETARHTKYSLNAKRYEASPAMTRILHEPQLAEAVRVFLGEKTPLSQPVVPSRSDAKVDVSVVPVRKAAADVERRVFLALPESRRRRVKRWSVHSSRGSLRDIAPRMEATRIVS